MIKCHLCQHPLLASQYVSSPEECYHCDQPLSDEVKAALKQERDDYKEKEVVENQEKQSSQTATKEPSYFYHIKAESDGYTIWAWILVVVAFAMIIWGLVEIYADASSYSVDLEDLVKAVRGVAILCIGIIFALTGIVCALFSSRISRKRKL
ncbi:MAG: hypothetical protein AB1631_28545 [Acidobacteriota bacterium]